MTARVRDTFLEMIDLAVEMLTQPALRTRWPDASALEGYTFLAPKGQETVRAKDHAMLQPMFVAKLDQSGSELTATVVKTLSATDTAPPQK